MSLNITQHVKRLLLFSSSLVFTLAVSAQQPSVKIDLNMSGRPDAEVQFNNPPHTPWVVKGKPSGDTVADTLVVNGVSFILKKGPHGVSLATTYYKASVQAGAFDAKFTNDGIWVKDGLDGTGLAASIDLIIKGLPAGVHNLTTFHNVIDNWTPDRVTPLDVYVNDVLKIDDLIPTVRLEKITEVAKAELEITAVEGEDVVISFRAETSGSQSNKTIFMNGIYLNTGNIGNKARAVDPLNHNGHVDAAIGSGYTLKWEPSPTSLFHDVYFGKDSLGVASADHDSEYYRGRQQKADTTYAVSDLYSMDTYYWRIDEVSGEATHKGDVWMFRTRQLAFPGAEGYGRFARGGRGGKVVYVTNLNDSGPGSLREAVTNNIGPRTIVFNVGGVIALKSRLVLSDPFVTIAGQTAPGKGICLRESPFGIGANDAIIRNVRLRLGAGPTADGMGMNGDNSIMDHCSISWTIDEAFSSRGAKNITLQKTLISEALNAAGHKNYPAGTEHGYAATVGGNTASLHHNLLAHCYGRNWSLGGGLDANGYFASRLDIRNNVVYNWGSRATDGGAHEVNFVNNYYKPGAGTRIFVALNAQYENVGMGTQKYFFDGNVMPGYFDEATQTKGRKYSLSNGNPPLTYDPWVNQPFFDSFVTTQSAYHGYKVVLSDVGANQPFFDLHDTRMINETLTGTYSVKGSVTGKPGFPDSELDSGGYEDYPLVTRTEDWDTDMDGLPDWWEKLHGLNPESAPGDFSDANADNDRDGFTNLDDYLQWMAEPHYQSVAGEMVEINIADLSRGFNKTGPSYSFSNIVNGNVKLNGAVAEFTPEGEGLGSFEFTVIDVDGHSMTRKVNVITGVDLTLPVTITSFEAERKNNKEALLKWKTATESNNSHFEVLRSDDGVSFRNLGVKVNSKALNGNSVSPLYYEFADFNDNVNTTYYKLVQKDKDGEASWSEIKIVKGAETVFNVWPVPSDREVYISAGDLKESARLHVYDISGREVLSKHMPSGDTTKIAIDAKGIYVLKIKTVNNNTDLLTEKIVIQ